MILRELITRLGFDADNSGANNHEAALARVRKVALGLTAAYTATIGAAGALAIKMAASANVIDKSAAEAGLAADEYQRLSFAMGQISQASQGDADRALGRLSQRIGIARIEGGKYADALIDMGFTQDQIASGAVTTASAMDALTDRLGRAGSAQEAAAIAGDILGTRIGRRLGPALYANAEAFKEQQERAKALGGGWSDLAIEEGADLTDRMAEVGLITTSLSSLLAEKLIPATNAVISGLVDWYVANRKLITQNLKHYLEVIGRVISTMHAILSSAAKAVDSVAQAMGGWERILRLVSAAITGFIALKFGGILWGVVAAIAGATSGAGLLRLAMMALSRIPIIALFTALGLLLEDLIVWINGGDSAIGKWLGSWDAFSAKALAVINNVIAYIQPLIDQFKAVGEIIMGVFTLDIDRIMQGFIDLGIATWQWASKVFNDVAGIILAALMPDIGAVMAGMAELGKRIMSWALSIGKSIAAAILPDFVADFIGVKKESPSQVGQEQTYGSEIPQAYNGGTQGGSIENNYTNNKNIYDKSVTQQQGMTQEQYNDEIKKYAQGLQGAVTPNATQAPEKTINQNVKQTSTSTRNVNVNARVESTIQVPQGTSAEQQQAIREQTEKIVGEVFDREIGRSLQEMPE